MISQLLSGTRKGQESASAVAQKTMAGVIRLATAFVSSLLLLIPVCAQAQTARDMMNLFGAIMRSAIVEKTRAEWRKIPPAEFACVQERAMQELGARAQDLIDQGVGPNDGRLSGIRAKCRSLVVQSNPSETQTPAIPASFKPTFDCARATTPVAMILCLNRAGASADWNLSSAFWARLSSLPENARPRFKAAHEKWFPVLNRACRLTPGQTVFSSDQQQCVLTAFRRKADSYRSQLSGDALLESRLTPEQHVDVQRALIGGNFLQAEADGEFGPITRDAIKRFQERSGFPQTGVLAGSQLRLLLPGSDTPPAGPSQEDCQSRDTQKRLEGCTLVIDAGGASKNRLADAFDGRCWAYNDLQQYARGLADCKQAITLNPRNPYAHNNLGTSYFGLNDVPNAISAITKSVELKPDFLYSRLNLAKVALASGDRELAKTHCDYAVKLNPSHAEVKECVRSLGPSELILEARQLLEDLQQCVSEQTLAFPIIAVATEAATLRRANDELDDVTAGRSLEQLKELLRPLKPLDDCIGGKAGSRLSSSIAQGREAIADVDRYVTTNLGDPKTDLLFQLRQKIADAIERQVTTMINLAISSLQEYAGKNNVDLRARSTPGPAQSSKPEITAKSEFLTRGSADDIVLIYNAAPAAPNIWKNVKGEFVFQGGKGFVCFVHSSSNAQMVRYIERALRADGADQNNAALARRCDLSDGGEIDIIAFRRSAFWNEASNARQIVDLVNQDKFREYKILTEFLAYQEQLKVLSGTIEQEVREGSRKGYGVILIDESGGMCIVAGASGTSALKPLLIRDQGLTAPSVTNGWRFSEVDADAAFRGIQRKECGLIAAGADDLRGLIEALQRERVRYKMTPVWFEDADLVPGLSTAKALIEIQNARLDRYRKLTHIKKNRIKTEELRQKNGPIASGLLTGIHTYVKDIAEHIEELMQQRKMNEKRWFRTYADWIVSQFSESWNTTGVASSIVDFGSVEWRGRSLNAVIVETKIDQENRVRGEKRTACFYFALVDDPEFRMQRQPLSVRCESSAKSVSDWRLENRFITQWVVY